MRGSRVFEGGSWSMPDGCERSLSINRVRSNAAFVRKPGYGVLFCFHLNLDADGKLLQAVAETLRSR